MGLETSNSKPLANLVEQVPRIGLDPFYRKGTTRPGLNSMGKFGIASFQSVVAYGKSGALRFYVHCPNSQESLTFWIT